MKLVNPGPRDIEACQHAVVSSLRIVKLGGEVTVRQNPGSVRASLRKFTANVKRARISIERLPASEQRALRTNEILGQLRRVERESAERADNTSVKRSGGRTVSAAERNAADQAFDLLTMFGGYLERVSPQGKRVRQAPEPRLTRRGRYFELTGLLIKLATGRKADAERACRSYFAELRKDGYPEAKELREQRRAGKGAGKSMPDWLVALCEQEDGRETGKK